MTIKHAQMKRVLAAGRGLILDGQIITDVKDLPDEVDSAMSDESDAAALETQLETQLAEAMNKLDRLRAGRLQREAVEPKSPAAPAK